MTWTWARAASTSASGGSYSRSSLAGASVSFIFRGTGVGWYTTMGPGMGKADVYIDGVRRYTVDNYSSTTKYGIRRSVGTLTDAVHTLKIVALGQRRSTATGTSVVVDRFGVT